MNYWGVMNKYIKLMSDFDIDQIVKDSGREFDYNFNENEPRELMEEIDKLIYFFWHTTYITTDLIRLSNINNNLLYYDDKLLRYIKTLYDLSIKQRYEDKTHTLAYYLYSLNYSYKNGTAYKNNKNNITYLNLVYSIFNRREFYNNGSIINGAYSFSQEVIAYAIQERERIFELGELILDCCGICSLVDSASLQNSIDQLIKSGAHYNRFFIQYDKNIANNFQIYFDFEILKISAGMKDEITVIKELYQNDLIGEKEEVQILFTLRARFADINDENNYIRKLSIFEDIENDIICLRNLSFTSEKLKDNLKTFMHEVQSATRNLVKNHVYEGKSIQHTSEIPTQYVIEFFNGCDKDIISTICHNCIIRFDKLIEASLMKMVDSILSFVSVVTIENKEEGLYLGDDLDAPESAFNTYYSEKMEEYLKINRGKFLNPHLFEKRLAYRRLLDYVKDIYQIHLGLPANLLREKYSMDVERKIYENLFRTSSDDYFDDYYIMLMPIIIQIEAEITKLYNHLNQENKTDFEENYLEFIFENVQDDDLYANMLMYINFVLYDRNGLRIRDKLAHGNFLSGFRDLNIFLLVTVSGILMHSFYDIKME